MEKDSYFLAKTKIFTDMSVTAGAGAGKTTSLKDRYVHIITESGGKAADITAVTFTRKAAAEMRSKVTKEALHRLNAGLKAGDAAQVRFYKEMKDDLQTADISTFHSLCAKILKEHPHEAGTDPDFRLLDENLAKQLLDEAILESIQSDLAGEEPCAATLVQSYGFAGAVKVTKNMFDNPYLTETVFGEFKPGECAPADEVRRAYLDTVDSLHKLYFLVRGRYAAAKAKLGSIDFNDLEMLTKGVLKRNSAILRHYQKRIKFLLVDEFQDTNPIQKEIIYLLAPRALPAQSDSSGGARRPYLFIVGDPKQSIYSFRNADVKIFNEVKRDIGEENSLYLLKNFRSHKKIVDFVNIFFDSYMAAPVSEFDTPYEPLIHARQANAQDDAQPRVKCIFFDESTVLKDLMDDPFELDENAKPLSKKLKPKAEDYRKFEAKIIAEEIYNIVNGGRKIVYEDKSTLRAARYGDFMVLFKAATNVEFYTKELKMRGIPYSISSGTPFFNRQYVRDMLNLLKAARNPHDDIALCGILRSPFVLISDAALFIISLAAGNSLYEKLMNTQKDASLMSELS